MTGGGSGGHIAPVLAVAHEIKLLEPGSHITYVGQRGDDLLDVVHAHQAIDAVATISAGKLRRYSGEGMRQLLDIKTQVLNVRDVFRAIRGTFQSYRLLGKLQPDVLFTRGSFLSVPVAVAARLRRIPYITHDADSVPSLANRLIAGGASLHAVAMPVELYSYPPDKTVMVGMPVSEHHRFVTTQDQIAHKAALGLQEYKEVLLVTGGGNGARMLNKTAAQNARYLLATFPHLVILHVSGRSLEGETKALYDSQGLGKARSRVKVLGFSKEFYRLTGAADVVVGRGGMGSIAELAVQQKACVLVPSKQLSWNVKNSLALAGQGAVVELTEAQAEQPERLGRTVAELLNDPQKRQSLAERLGKFAHPHASRELAELVVKTGKRQL